MIVAFWNVKKNNSIDPLIMDLIEENNIDILVLAEYDNDIDHLCKSLNFHSTQFKTLPCTNWGCDKIKGLYSSRYSHDPLMAVSRYYISSFYTTYFKVIIGMIHAPSNMYRSDADRIPLFSQFYSDILKQELETKTYNTVILGDFNSNPFERSILGADSLHAIPYKEETVKPTRKVDGKSYRKFYNPSWKLLSPDTPPYGTYYYNKSSYLNYYWNVYDQVIIRPELINSFVDNSLRIITQIKDKSLLSNNYKPNEDYSDHLPIVFEIKEEKIK